MKITAFLEGGVLMLAAPATLTGQSRPFFLGLRFNGLLKAGLYWVTDDGQAILEGCEVDAERLSLPFRPWEGLDFHAEEADTLVREVQRLTSLNGDAFHQEVQLAWQRQKEWRRERFPKLHQLLQAPAQASLELLRSAYQERQPPRPGVFNQLHRPQDSMTAAQAAERRPETHTWLIRQEHLTYQPALTQLQTGDKLVTMGEEVPDDLLPLPTFHITTIE